MKENDNNSLAETLVNYEMLIEMILELGEVVYTGMVTLDAAKAVFQELSEVNQIDFVESLDCVKRMLQQRDSRIKEMENDIAAKTVVETPADYISLQKANRDMERQNEFLEATHILEDGIQLVITEQNLQVFRRMQLYLTMYRPRNC